MKFLELLKTYNFEVEQYAKQGAEFEKREQDVAQRQAVQVKLIKAFERQKAKTAKQRIKLFTQQLEFTQGMQELELLREEIGLLLSELVVPDTTSAVESTADDDSVTPAQGLQKLLAKVEGQIKELRAGKLERCISEMETHTGRIKLPANSEDYRNTKAACDALLMQQQRTLEMSLQMETNNAWQESFKQDERINSKWHNGMNGYLKNQVAALATAQMLMLSHEMADQRGGEADLPLRERIDAQETELRALLKSIVEYRKTKLDAKFMGRLNVSGPNTQSLVAEVQRVVQLILRNDRKQDEGIKLSAAQYKIVVGFLSQEIPPKLEADSPQEETYSLEKLLQNPHRDTLKILALKHETFEELSATLSERKDKDQLIPYLEKLKEVSSNEAVQGPFLIGNDGELLIRSDKKDSDFFAQTSSAQGDYNDPKNIGMYIYHVTALGNILRRTGEGISAVGLSPGRGGELGGSCGIAEEEPFPEPEEGHVPNPEEVVNIKEASVVNSQNKVAASSNRNEGMRVYIQQREQHNASLMKESSQAGIDKDTDIEEAKARQAALDTAIMLRFPIRVEYLGRFNDDPVHLADNLQLLDGTPVPPDDIECLVHKQWVSITNAKFLETFKEMFGVV